jgi:hypothetical protein
MGYLIKAPLGLGLFIGGIVLFNVKLVSLLETGTCASGNTPYQISQPCPAGTGTDILLLIASIIGGLIGAAIFALRGNSPWNRDGRGGRFGGFSFGIFAWGAFFTATGATSLIASLTDQAIEDSSGGQLGGIIVGATFLVMGVPALLIALAGVLRGLSRRDEGPPSMTATANRLPWGASQPASGGGTSGQIGKLERLQRLRETGALTDAEFEREKARVLSEG